MVTPEDHLRRARAIVDSIKPLMAGQGPDVHGAALVELVALHVAGHPPPMRDEVLRLHVEFVRRLVPVIEGELFGPAGHPSLDA